MRGFPVAEFAARTQAAQRLMAANGLGALLLTTEADVAYFTGFLTRFWASPTRPWFVVIPAAGAPIAVIPAIGAALMGQTWVQDIRTWAAPDYDDDGVSLLIDTLKGRGSIGVPDRLECHLRMPLADFRKLSEAVEIIGDGGVTARLRSIKSEAEISKIRQACGIAGRAFARVPEIAREGVPLDRVFRDFQRLCLEEGADHVAYLAGGGGPDGYLDVISPATETPLARSDILMLDTGCVWDGYFCDYDRNFAVGPPSDTAKRGHAKLIQAVNAAMTVARPGARACDLFEAMAAVVGGGAGGRLGHGLGAQLTEGVSLIAADKTVLKPGMVLTLEPGINTEDDRIMVHEENIVIRDGPPERLSLFATDEMMIL